MSTPRDQLVAWFLELSSNDVVDGNWFDVADRMLAEGWYPPMADWEKELTGDLLEKSYSWREMSDVWERAREMYLALTPRVQIMNSYRLGYDDGFTAASRGEPFDDGSPDDVSVGGSS